MDVEEIPTEAPKRGRGRPKGSLNKKTLERMSAQAREAEVPEVLEEASEEASEETPEETPEEVTEEAPEEVPEEVPEPPPRPKRKAAAKRAPEVPAPPAAKPRAKRAPPAPRAPPVAPPKPRSYLEVLREGLEDARRRQKQERATRYDSYFAY